jgi:uncharacterized protein YdeI (BOF family)
MERSFAKQRIITDIRDDDNRIQVTGYIKEISDDGICILDDKTGSLKINIQEREFPYKQNDLINVIGEINIEMNGEKELEAEIIQDMKNLNFEYYQKLYQLKKEI